MLPFSSMLLKLQMFIFQRGHSKCGHKRICFVPVRLHMVMNSFWLQWTFLNFMSDFSYNLCPIIVGFHYICFLLHRTFDLFYIWFWLIIISFVLLQLVFITFCFWLQFIFIEFCDWLQWSFNTCCFWLPGHFLHSITDYSGVFLQFDSNYNGVL